MANSVIGDSFLVGDEDVGTAGTEEQIDSTARRIRSLLIIAKDTNTGRIYYGGSDVASTTQLGLTAGESIILTGDKPFSIDEVYIDSSVNGEGVDFVAALA